MPRFEQTVAYGTESVLPNTVRTLPMFTGVAKISDSYYKQTTLFAIVAGESASSGHTESVAIGRFANTIGGAATVDGAVAIGRWATANSDSGISIGHAADSGTGSNGIAIGTDSSASASGASDRISIGRLAGNSDTSTGAGNIAIGHDASGQGSSNESIAIGKLSRTNALRALALGVSTSAAHQNSVALGYGGVSTQVGEFVVGAPAAGAVTLISFRPAAGTPVRHRNSADGWCVRDVGNLNDIFKVDESAVAGDIRLLLWDVTAGALKRVTMAAAGAVPAAGFRALQVPV